MDYVGDYILTPKEDSFWVDNDIVTLVYKINVHNRYQNFNDEVYEGDNSYYWYISFKNVSVDGSGNVASGLNSYDSAEERVTIDSGLQQFSFSDSTMNWYNKSDDESYRDSRLDEIGRLSVSCHIQRNLPDALYTDEQWGCISDFGCMPTELVALSRAEKPDTPYISHTSSLVMQMIQKTSLEELKQMGHTYLNYVRRNSSKNPLEDWKQAVNYYYAGAAQGDAECAAAVGYCCEMDPRGSNLPLALAWYQHAAKAGSAWAMEKVATFYEEGYGCTANRALADACRETLKYMR